MQNLNKLALTFDMAGCPNRCRHCWLGGFPNGSMSADEVREWTRQFREWRGEDGGGIGELSVSTWWREPDYRDDYRELWELERELSSPGCAERFELLSIWRLARDESYAPWAATLPPKSCQISFAGMEENTDWFTRRRGSFRDSLLATERLIDAGLSPRWQLFMTKRALGEQDEFLRLMRELRLKERCAAFGGRFEMFVNTAAPDGNSYELEDIRLDEDDLPNISPELIAQSRDGWAPLGTPERDLVAHYAGVHTPPRFYPPIKALAVTAGWDVYPNNAEPAPWWRLGNLKRNGVDAVMRAYTHELPPGMVMNRTVPVSELAARHGDVDGRKLYNGEDVVIRWCHQWGMDNK
jgi:MoaA/NifB/PqqE/SkfB family radical SAM enzyme